MALFKGAGVALVTPMHEDGTVNFEVLEAIIEDQIASGTDAIISVGTTGEAATLTVEEHLEVIRHTIKVVNHRIPVIAGTGSNCTRSALYTSKCAEEAGADGLLLVTPYYNKATQKGLYQHFKTIAESVSIPSILYNVPGRTGMSIEAKKMAALYHDVKNIIGVKDASGDVGKTLDLMHLVDEDFCLYSGEDGLILPLLAAGSLGVISVLSNVAPKETHDICAKWFAGDVEGSRKEQLRAMPLIRALFSEVNPIPVKAAMNLQGKKVGPLRLPLTEMEKEHLDSLKEEMIRYGILK